MRRETAAGLGPRERLVASQRLLNEYAEAKKTGVWRGYPMGIEPIKLAPWQKEKELA